jgi:hypothetical protein
VHGNWKTPIRKQVRWLRCHHGESSRVHHRIPPILGRDEATCLLQDHNFLSRVPGRGQDAALPLDVPHILQHGVIGHARKWVSIGGRDLAELAFVHNDSPTLPNSTHVKASFSSKTKRSNLRWDQLDACQSLGTSWRAKQSLSSASEVLPCILSAQEGWRSS